MQHRRGEERAEDETDAAKEVAEGEASLDEEQASEELVPAPTPKVARRRREPGGIKRRRPLLGIVAEEQDGDEGADVVAKLDEGVDPGRSNEGDDACTYVARVQWKRVVVEGSPDGPDSRGIERSDCLVKPAADERMRDRRAGDVERESSAVCWTVFTWDLHSA